MLKKEKFVKPEKVDEVVNKHDLNYLLLLGKRSNGKSSAVKSLLLQRFLLTGKKFVYVRRYALDMKAFLINMYFKSVPGFDIEAMTDGRYTFIQARNKELFLCNTDEDGKVQRGPSIGYYIALSEVEHMKSLNFDADRILFEEFCTDQAYIDNEVSLLFSITSSVFRLRTGVVFMVANTISRVCPYFREFNLDEINKGKPGDIQVYKYDTTNIGVWLTSEGILEDGEEGSSMYFGARAKMINKGEWEQKQERKLENRKHEYEVLYTMVFRFYDHTYLMEFLSGPGGSHVWYVSPKTTQIQPGTRIVSNTMIESDLTTFGFVPISEKERLIFNLLKQGKVCFSDNLSGTEFKQAYAQMQGEAGI